MKLLTSLIFLLLATFSYSQTRTSTGSGDWDDPNNWTPVGIPQDGEEIIIAAGHTMTIDGTPDITLDNVEITINGTLDIDNDGFGAVGNLNLTGDSGLLISATGNISESIPALLEGFGGISLDGVTIWTACSNPICVGIVNAALDPDPELNGPVTGGAGGLLLPAVSNPLPVELMSFKAVLNENMVSLNWVTASELNNDRFEVERSIDGVNFEQLGKVNGHGTTSELQEYSFKDIHPLLGFNYYRLKQLDFDGAFEYSPLTYANVSGVSSLSSINVYPNPAKDKIFIKSSSNLLFTKLSLIAMSGKEVAKLSMGLNNEIQLPELKSGPYVLEYVTLDGNQGFKRILIE